MKFFRAKKTPGKTVSSWDRASRRSANCFLLPSLVGVLIFFIVPFCVIIYYSVIDGVMSRQFAGLANFIRVLQNGAFQQAAANTLRFTFVAVPLAVVLSMAMASLMVSYLPGKSHFRTLFLSPLMVPVASVILVFQVLFHYNGVVNDFLALFGADKIDWLKSDLAPLIIVLLFLWKNLGYNMILFMAGMSSIPKSAVEVARLDCSSNIKLFFLVKLRYLSPTILFVTILSVISSFKVFREVYLLTGDYPYESLYLLQHFMNNTFRSLDYQTMSAAAVLLFLVMVAIIGVLFVAENRFGKDVET